MEGFKIHGRIIVSLCRAWLWVMIMMLMVPLSPCYGCREQERIALLQLKAYVNYPNGTSLRSWIENTASDCCQWERVECNPATGHVSVLSLNDTRYWTSSTDWNFNASVFLPFEELRKLYLADNKLAGWVENEGFDKLPMSLKNLELLDLSWNRLNNSVLPSLSGFSSLKYLYLGLNQLKGSTNHSSIERLFGLSNLEILDLCFNNLNNNILSYLGSRFQDVVALESTPKFIYCFVFHTLHGKCLAISFIFFVHL